MLGPSAACQPRIGGVDALLVIDQHRASVVERVVSTWGAPLAQSDAFVPIDVLRERLMALRADELLAASLAGTLDDLRQVIGAGAPSPAPSAASAALITHTKAVGDTGDDVSYTPVTPCRLVETRGTFAAVYRGNGAPSPAPLPFAPGEIRTYAVQGGNGVCLSQLPAGLGAAAVQLQVFGMPTTAASGDIEILPQGSSFGSTATMVYIGSIAFNTVSTNAKINLGNNEISVQVRGGGANLAIDVVGYFKRPGNYAGTNTIVGTAAAIVGGMSNGTAADYATVAGGSDNHANGLQSFVGGGADNVATGINSVVSGGGGNQATEQFSAVVGGLFNVASGYAGTVLGGTHNLAGAVGAIAGGESSSALGGWSVALGTNAVAREDGMFVLSDNRPFGFDPTTFRAAGQSANTFNVRATGVGGVFFVTGINASTGAPTWGCYAQNGGGWTCTSDRNVKRNLQPVDSRRILQKVVRMPIFEWQPKEGANADVHHLGPMAQDFRAAFELGDSDKGIGLLDAAGVALGAIQGLDQRVEARDSEIAKLHDQVAKQARELARLRRSVDLLLARFGTRGGSAPPAR